jgi:hypothetical protein
MSKKELVEMIAQIEDSGVIEKMRKIAGDYIKFVEYAKKSHIVYDKDVEFSKEAKGEFKRMLIQSFYGKYGVVNMKEDIVNIDELGEKIMNVNGLEENVMGIKELKKYNLDVITYKNHTAAYSKPMFEIYSKNIKLVDEFKHPDIEQCDIGLMMLTVLFDMGPNLYTWNGISSVYIHILANKEKGLSNFVQFAEDMLKLFRKHFKDKKWDSKALDGDRITYFVFHMLHIYIECTMVVKDDYTTDSEGLYDLYIKSI